MLRDGTVLDPMCDEPKRLSDYKEVNFVAAVIPVARTPTELVERVARAIYGSGMTCEPWERLCGSSQTRYRRYARAAIEAMENRYPNSRFGNPSPKRQG
jgi:hypothetical protein